MYLSLFISPGSIDCNTELSFNLITLVDYSYNNLDNEHTNYANVWAFFVGFAHCFLLAIYTVILLVSAKYSAVSCSSGLESTDSSHSGTCLPLTSEDTQQIVGIIAGMLYSSSAIPLTLLPTLPTTTIASVTAMDITVSHAGI